MWIFLGILILGFLGFIGYMIWDLGKLEGRSEIRNQESDRISNRIALQNAIDERLHFWKQQEHRRHLEEVARRAEMRKKAQPKKRRR